MNGMQNSKSDIVVCTYCSKQVHSSLFPQHLSLDCPLTCIFGCSAYFSCPEEKSQHELLCFKNSKYCEFRELGCIWVGIPSAHIDHIDVQCRFLRMICPKCCKTFDRIETLYACSDFSKSQGSGASIIESCFSCKEIFIVNSEGQRIFRTHEEVLFHVNTGCCLAQPGIEPPLHNLYNQLLSKCCAAKSFGCEFLSNHPASTESAIFEHFEHSRSCSIISSPLYYITRNLNRGIAMKEAELTFSKLQYIDMKTDLESTILKKNHQIEILSLDIIQERNNVASLIIKNNLVSHFK